jgi:hypothetical protein
MRIVATFVVSASLSLVRCIPSPFPSIDYVKTDHKTWTMVPDPTFCSELANSASDLSVTEAAFGWISAGLSVAATTTGTVIEPIHSNETIGEKMFAASMIATGVGLAAMSLMLFDRSKAAGLLASQADAGSGAELTGSAGEIQTRIAECNRALAAWDSSRDDAVQYASTLLQQQKTATSNAQGSASQAQSNLANFKNTITNAVKSSDCADDATAATCAAKINKAAAQ